MGFVDTMLDINLKLSDVLHFLLMTKLVSLDERQHERASPFFFKKKKK